MKTVQQLFDIAVKKGIKNDPRSPKKVAEFLETKKKEFDSLPRNRKAFFNAALLKTPYADSAIHYGAKAKIKRLAVGIDCEGEELLLVSELNNRGAKIDGVMSHHPLGSALGSLDQVMRMQNDLLANYNVPINIAEKIMTPRAESVRRSVHSANLFRERDIAQKLNMPFFNVHTPADNCVYQFLEKKVAKKKYKTLNEIIDKLLEIPEYIFEAKRGILPIIACGSGSSTPGRVAALEMTGGTNGSEKIFPHIAASGVGTILSMHISEKSRKEAAKAHLNVIVCPHIASDNIGINLICDEFEKVGTQFVELSGFHRVSRVKK